MKCRGLRSALVLALVTTVGAVAPSALAQKTTITIASWTGNDALIESVLPGFLEQHPDLEVRVVGGLGYDDYHPALNNRLQSGNVEDVVSIGGQFVVGYAEGNLLENLAAEPYGADAAFLAQFNPNQVALATGPTGNVAAIPNDAPPQVTFYRHDVLQEAGLSAEDITSSWDAYLAAGETLKEQGVFISNGATDVASTIWSSNIPEGEGVFFDAEGSPVVDSERFVRAFTVAKQLRDAGLDSRIGGWTPEWFDAFKTGKVASIITGSWFENILIDQVDPEGAGNWRVALAPEGATTVNGGAFFAIPTAAQNKEAAWELIQYLTADPAVQAQVFAESGNFPANLRALEEPVFGEEVAYFGGQKAYEVYAEAARAITPAVSSADFALADTIVRDALTQVLEQGADIEGALADAQALIERRTRR